MNILALETSCDEIAAAVVDDTFLVRSHIIFSSVDLAKKTGGVVPEVAARDAGKKMVTVVKKAMEGFLWDDISAIAVTHGPGLIGSLLVGIEAAKTLSMLHEKPLIPVHHIFGHICANLLHEDSENCKNNPQFPIIVLTVSGGHNDLLLWKNWDAVELLGSTIDDAAGECFDKCARMLGLPYPGGPELSRLAEMGDSALVHFPRPMMQSGDFQFSFSGLKTALLYYLRDLPKEPSAKEKANIAASVEEAIIETLVAKCFSAVDAYRVREVHISGGVSANRLLRKRFQEEAEKRGIAFRFPKNILFCTDNAAMIGAAAQVMYKHSPGREWKSSYVAVHMKREIEI
ncbi:MAG: tRNA (adenosine(37)-N6)-threonylcarbamoyltransferase complex transferase subunit TsaD [Candidatus Peregrinibacteria bacterium]